MMKRLVLVVVCVVFCLSLYGMAGCIAPSETRASAPLVMSVPGDNPDVIWVVREFQVEERLFYGLFACYRAPADAPGPPKCYLAETAGDVADLSWPGTVYVRDGELLSK